MRHKYPTRAFVLARAPLGETNARITLLTEDIGLVRARAQGLRRPGAKLASSLVTFTESSVTLVRGAEEWRITGSALPRHWFAELSRDARTHASRVVGLLIRFTGTESADSRLFEIVAEMFTAFLSQPKELYEAIEYRAVLRLLAALGLDEGDIPTLETVPRERPLLIARINRGITHSGL